jgi:uncharacterized spore protein YtfJ
MNEQVEVPVPRDRAGEFVVRMAEAIGGRAGAATVFAPPVGQNGTTVIPVAQAVWGFGGGTGRKKGENAAAEPDVGGGGGAIVRPVGYIVITSGRVSYGRITAIPALLLAALTGAAVAAVLCRRGGGADRRG